MFMWYKIPRLFRSVHVYHSCTVWDTWDSTWDIWDTLGYTSTCSPSTKMSGQFCCVHVYHSCTVWDTWDSTWDIWDTLNVDQHVHPVQKFPINFVLYMCTTAVQRGTLGTAHGTFGTPLAVHVLHVPCSVPFVPLCTIVVQMYTTKCIRHFLYLDEVYNSNFCCLLHLGKPTCNVG